MRLLLPLLLLCLLLSSCPPPINFTPCDSDEDCPSGYSCDQARHYCHKLPSEPCEILHLTAGGLAGFEGESVQVRVRGPGGAEVDRFETTVTSGGLDQPRELHLEPDRRYRLTALLDLNGDGLCGPGDRSWAQDLRVPPCPAVVVLAEPSNPGELNCQSFAYAADLDGDGCVNEHDLRILLRDYGLRADGHAGDLNHDGQISLADLSLLLSQYCEGDPICCDSNDAGVAADPDRNRLTGDLDCDGQVNNLDLQPFDLARDDPTGYAAAYPDCPRANADLNCDGAIDATDAGILASCAPTQTCGC